MRLLALLLAFSICSAETIPIWKRGILYQFVPYDSASINFAQGAFSEWEEETFDVFEMVKDPEGVAIDLGAWIGATSIWLSKHFSDVIAVDADRVSLECLKLNLEASDCRNVTICDRPVYNKTQKIIFGPRGNILNESISFIKSQSDRAVDYSAKTITFNQLLHNYVYRNDQIRSKKISFIKCDIEGGEENILEDVLYFAFHNQCKVYMSFHLGWWTSKKIQDFAYLFPFFKASCPGDVCEYIQQHPFDSILFEPIETTVPFIKKNIPVVVIAHNQATFIKNMVSQLEKFTSDIIVVDNNSDFPPLLEYYDNEFQYTLLKEKINHGHVAYQHWYVQNLVGNYYLLTDPDLRFNKKLPEGFVDTLLEISNYFDAQRVGFALNIDADDLRTDIPFLEGERLQWRERLIYPLKPDLELYQAGIDTTFCLMAKHHKKGNIRVAGDFTCDHIPWHKDFKKDLLPGEYASYIKNNNSSHWYEFPD